MTTHELARLLLRYPARPACVEAGGVLREVERVRIREAARYMPPREEAVFAVSQVIVLDAIEDQSGESLDLHTASPASDLSG